MFAEAGDSLFCAGGQRFPEWFFDDATRSGPIWLLTLL
jgi:hypothetical protein